MVETEESRKSPILVLRQELGMRQTAFAAAVGLTSSEVSRLERSGGRVAIPARLKGGLVGIGLMPEEAEAMLVEERAWLEEQSERARLAAVKVRLGCDA